MLILINVLYFLIGLTVTIALLISIVTLFFSDDEIKKLWKIKKD